MLSIAPKPKMDGTGSGGEENREAPRRPASAVPAITGVRISPHGVEATLVNISESGVLTECGERLKPGSAVTVVFEGTFTPRSVEGRVARNTVSSMGKDGRLRYHVGIAFTKTISLGPDESAPGNPEPEGPVLVQPTARNRW
jgi:PilZ domain